MSDREAMREAFEAWQERVGDWREGGWDAWQAACAWVDSWPDIRRLALEEAARECEKWGDAKVAKWQSVDADMAEHAKAHAWSALQCAAAIRAREEKRDAD